MSHWKASWSWEGVSLPAQVSDTQNSELRKQPLPQGTRRSMSPQVCVRERNQTGRRRNRWAKLPALIHWSEMQSAHWSRRRYQKDNARPSPGNCRNAVCQHKALPSAATWCPPYLLPDQDSCLFHSASICWVPKGYSGKCREPIPSAQPLYTWAVGDQHPTWD